ncbi:MAG: HEAT repeat domain-containing protein [Acidobacteria bacterium]|nr:HEAT repeat domain-containing protein [Acidobacteriota bacterium]
MSALLVEISELANPEKYSLEAAEAAALKMVTQGQRVPELIVLALQSATPPPPGHWEQMVQLLERLTSRERLLQIIDRAIPAAHPDSREKLRSLYLKATSDLSWLPEALAAAGVRTRANLIEALWRAEPTEELREVFAKAFDMENHRMAGNALVGLFRLQDPRATAWTLRMLQSDSPECRASGAWVVGRVGWTGGVPKLQRLLTDHVPRVQNAAAKSLQRLRRLQTRVA